MIFEINISLVTDGDFCIRSLPDCESGIVQVVSCDPDGSISIKAQFDTKENANAKQDAVDYLAKFMCELHVSHTRYWLLGELVDMFLRAISCVGGLSGCYQRLGGNYEGTEIEIKAICEVEPQERSDEFEILRVGKWVYKKYNEEVSEDGH